VGQDTEASVTATITDVDDAGLQALAVMIEVQRRAASGAYVPSTQAALVVASQEVQAPPNTTTHAQLHAARVHLSEQNVVGGPTRLRRTKRALLRVSRLFTHRLVAAGQAIAEGVESLDATVAHLGAVVGQHDLQLLQLQELGQELRQELRQEVARQSAETSRMQSTLSAQLTTVEFGAQDSFELLASELHDLAGSHDVRLTASTAVLATVHKDLRGLMDRLDQAEGVASHDRSELRRTRARLNRALRHAEFPAPVPGGAPAKGSTPEALDESTYVDFELSFRGTRDEIWERQKDALRFVTDLGDASFPLLDLGCGRGEWLELLRGHGVASYGVDANAEMVAEAVAHGVCAVHADAVEHLEQVRESSLQAVSAFHVAEHLRLDQLGRLLDASLLALRPGGRLLLETPNPTNLNVGAAGFYLDPTHLRPLHPEFLRFLVESRGFVDVEVHFVHPVVEDHVLRGAGPEEGYDDPRLRRLVDAVEWALFGPQDYLLVARRAEVVG